MKGDAIYLNDILHLSNEEIDKSKIRLMVSNKDIKFDPQKDAEDPSKQDSLNFGHLVNNSQKKIPFKKDTIAIGFIKIRDDYWLMTGIVRVLNDNGYLKPATAEYYLTQQYNFRLVVKYHKKSQQGILILKNIIDKLEVIEIWNPDKKVGDNTFPGYKNVRIGFKELKNKIELSDSWRAALSSCKGIYLISDMKTGKLYVGSAYGTDGMLGRWETYLNSGYDKREKENGKYPNKKFRELVKKEGMDYIKANFQYSILEVFTEDVSNEFIISRESWWKEVLLSRSPHGYNAN